MKFLVEEEKNTHDIRMCDNQLVPEEVWQCPQNGIKNMAAIALQCESNVKSIAVLILLSVPYSSLDIKNIDKPDPFSGSVAPTTHKPSPRYASSTSSSDHGY